MTLLSTVLGDTSTQDAIFIVLNLILIESLLSVDNAAVLATMVMDLPQDQRSKALRIGLIFAYIFRGTCLIFASFLIKVNWLKLVGGGYLFFLCLKFFYERIKLHKSLMDEAAEEVKEHKPKKRRILFLNEFWSTVAMVEAMDLVFSLDNVLAAVAYTDNIYLVIIGVFIGIITMRIVAGYFVKLMQKFPFLDTVAFIVIGVLGLRLIADYFAAQYPGSDIHHIMHSEWLDTAFSLTTIGIFCIPIFSSMLFNFPKKNR